MSTDLKVRNFNDFRRQAVAIRNNAFRSAFIFLKWDEYWLKMGKKRELVHFYLTLVKGLRGTLQLDLRDNSLDDTYASVLAPFLEVGQLCQSSNLSHPNPSKI